MVHSCAAIKCTARWTKGGNIKFHRIPIKHCDVRKAWLHALRRENYDPKYGFVCSKHFLESDYETNVHGNKVLRKGSVPSVFDYPDHLKKVIKKRRVLRRGELIKRPIHKYDNLKSRQLGDDIGDDVVQMEVEPDANNEFLKIDLLPSTSKSLSTPQAPLRRRRDPVYFGDFKESDLNDEVKRKRFWKVAQQTVFKYRKLNKYYECKARRLKARIKNVNDLLQELKNQQKISSSQLLTLQEGIPETQKQILFRQLKKSSRAKYTPQLRCFALTLHFYSASAYQYVRKMFGKHSLPHPRTLAKWYSSVDGTPGYTAEALQAVKNKVMCELEKGKQLYVGLMMDEMSIHEHIHWTGKRHVGFVDYGTGIANADCLPKAKNVLVFMLVGLNCRWKVPIAYFLVNTVSAEEKANMVKGCLYQLANTGVMVKSLTFDGCASNLAMCNVLGANMNFPDLKPFFMNPINNQKIHIILDACHMLKLTRNTLGDWGSLVDSGGNYIKWQFFKDLVQLQNDSGLHCATRLRSRHLEYSREKMKVKLAVQTFSTSVADALEYCNKDLNIAAFQNSEATVLFSRNLNNIFDFLNTRNFYGKIQYQKPLFKNNNEFVTFFVKSSIEYLSSLNSPNGGNILSSNRKTGFLGLIICLTSVQNLYDELIQTGCLKYLLTYKLSQDHLEMFFSAIRRRGGFNNNPTAWQFESAYKRLLVHSEIVSPDSANCLAQDDTSILNITSKINTSSLDLLSEEEDFSNSQQLKFLESHSEILNCMYLTDVIEYISGFVSKKIIKSINCNICATALVSHTSLSLLLNKKIGESYVSLQGM